MHKHTYTYIYNVNQYSTCSVCVCVCVFNDFIWLRVNDVYWEQMTAYGDMKPDDDQLWMNAPGSVHRCGNNVGLKQSWNHKNVGQTIVNHPHVY